MDMNIPGTDAWEMALGKPKSNLLTSQLRSEKQALDIVDTRSGRLTSSESAKPQDEQIREAAKEFESVFLFQMLKQALHLLCGSDIEEFRLRAILVQ